MNSKFNTAGQDYNQRDLADGIANIALKRNDTAPINSAVYNNRGSFHKANSGTNFQRNEQQQHYKRQGNFYPAQSYNQQNDGRNSRNEYRPRHSSQQRSKPFFSLSVDEQQFDAQQSDSVNINGYAHQYVNNMQSSKRWEALGQLVHQKNVEGSRNFQSEFPRERQSFSKPQESGGRGHDDVPKHTNLPILPASRSFDYGEFGATDGGSAGTSPGMQPGHTGRLNRFSSYSQSWGQMLPSDQGLENKLFGNDSSTGINFDDYERIPVRCTGRDVPEPIDLFSHVEFNSIVRNNIMLARYDRPTPVQKYAISTVMNERDMMACAQTGSGKTAAFLLPIINGILNGPMPIGKIGRKKVPVALILSPTRELCIQILEEARKFAYRSQLRCAVVYGGAPMGMQIKDIDRGVDLLVATTGRLIDFLERGIIGLSCIKYLVLDEADRMLDMGFEPQIRRIISEFDMPPTKSRLTLMFSATFPKIIQELASSFLHDYIFLCVGRIGSTSESIKQQIIFVREDDKHKYLMNVLDYEDPEALTLIFVETKRGADILENFLHQQNCRVSCIHGDRNQREREHALKLFRTGHTPILVATAVAARGLDVPNVRRVINFDMPNDINEYVHRIGRTGRVGNIGESLSFFNEGNVNIVHELISLLEECNQEIPDFLRSIAMSNRNKNFPPGNGRRSSYQSKGRYNTMNRSRDIRTGFSNLSSGGSVGNATRRNTDFSNRQSSMFNRSDSAPYSTYRGGNYADDQELSTSNSYSNMGKFNTGNNDQNRCGVNDAAAASTHSQLGALPTRDQAVVSWWSDNEN
ncbi:hypothetical protein GJ496_011691 [Pomphorhynchus laevis]|nr:hypothetical protein GJ496_011691 [Pomphorhynchus laevis]